MEKLESNRRRFEVFKKGTISSSKTVLEESYHPVDNYHRMKRFLEYKNILLELQESKDWILEIPGEEQFNASIEALIRVRETYLLPLDDLSRGIIETGSGIFNASPLNASDCHRIAAHALDSMSLKTEAVLWAEQAVKLADKEKIEDYFRFEVLKLFSRALRERRFNAEAVEVLKNALEFTEKTPEIEELLLEYESADRKSPGKRPKNLGYRTKSRSKKYNYKALCLGERVLPERNYSSLSCFYLDTSGLRDAYFRLWKVKVEEAGKYPHIVQFHDVLTDLEIGFLKAYSESRMERALVGDNKQSDNRVMQVAWGVDKDNKLFIELARRIGALTGLNLEGSAGSPLQIGNYGPGGYFVPHRDHREDGNPVNELGINRLATWMFYLSDVTAGGATIFPSAGVTVWPRKGSAAFWYNLKSSGHGDPLTLHSGCPVLIGSKWIANKWAYEYFQKFTKPCGREPYQFLVVEKGHH